jgi:hypothetical protein
MRLMKVVARARAGVALLVAGGCSGSSEPPVSVSAVVPSKAFNNAPVAVVIKGGPFRPAYTIDTGSGRTAIELSAFTANLLSTPALRVPVDALTWRSTGELAGDFPAGLGIGTYDVEVRDPRGGITVLPAGFTSLGPDHAPPTITFTKPTLGDPEAADRPVSASVRADDGYGHLQALRWTVLQHNTPLTSGDCPIDLGSSQTTCSFTFVTPTPDQLIDTVTIRAEAQDTVGNDATADAVLRVALRPRIFSYGPGAGRAGGMTDVRVTGENFVDGTKMLFDGTSAEAMVVESSTSLRGVTPFHEAASVPFTVRTGSFEIYGGEFEFVAAPRVRLIAPASGPLTGGTPVVIAGNDFRQQTEISFVTANEINPLGCPRVVSASRIEGVVPPGTGVATVYAYDPVAGMGEATVTFSYAGDPDGGVPAPDCPTGDGGTP